MLISIAWWLAWEEDWWKTDPPDYLYQFLLAERSISWCLAAMLVSAQVPDSWTLAWRKYLKLCRKYLNEDKWSQIRLDRQDNLTKFFNLINILNGYYSLLVQTLQTWYFHIDSRPWIGCSAQDCCQDPAWRDMFSPVLGDNHQDEPSWSCGRWSRVQYSLPVCPGDTWIWQRLASPPRPDQFPDYKKSEAKNILSYLLLLHFPWCWSLFFSIKYKDYGWSWQQRRYLVFLASIPRLSILEKCNKTNRSRHHRIMCLL